MGFGQVLSWLPLWCVFSLPTLTQLLCTPESLVSPLTGDSQEACQAATHESHHRPAPTLGLLVSCQACLQHPGIRPPGRKKKVKWAHLPFSFLFSVWLCVREMGPPGLWPVSFLKAGFTHGGRAGLH